MKIIFATLKSEKVKVVCEVLNLLTLLVVISKCLAEKISKEKRVSLKKVEDIVVNCIKDGKDYPKNFETMEARKWSKKSYSV